MGRGRGDGFGFSEILCAPGTGSVVSFTILVPPRRPVPLARPEFLHLSLGFLSAVYSPVMFVVNTVLEFPAKCIGVFDSREDMFMIEATVEQE